MRMSATCNTDVCAAPQSVTIGTATAHVTQQNDSLGLWMDNGKATGLVYEIGDRFDAVLATGSYDKFFLP